jgi:hypothetical protein
VSTKASTVRDKDNAALSKALGDARGAQERREERDRNYAEAEAIRPAFGVGDIVIVHEQGITDQIGEVHSLKWSGPAKVWYAEVRYEDGLSRSVPADLIKRSRREAQEGAR